MALPPADVVVVGQALETIGFQGFNTLSGLGLLTFGFLWPCDGIWIPNNDSSLVTNWVSVPQAVQTTETCQDDEGGLYG